MNDRTHYLTEEGLEKVKQELDLRTGVKRNEIADRLQFAIQQGDISENADYEVAKEDQAFNEGHIRQLENIVRHATIIQDVTTTDVVQIGSKVTVKENDSNPETYTIVGAPEAAPSEGKISNESPLGSALLGKRTGEEAVISAPTGKLVFVVTSIG
ncbi:MAG: transcription elongation factor GreA [Chloroflexota bacterium]